MDKEPKERIVFDESLYYGDYGTELAIEDISVRDGIPTDEVLENYTKEEIFENAMELMDLDRTEEFDGLKAFLDGTENPLGGNRIIARGSIGRWDGTSHGMTAYRDFDDMMSGTDSVFKDCQIDKVWDENGSLFIHGYHHDGAVEVEVRQLTDAGEEALAAIEDAWVGDEFTIAGKTYDGSAQSTMDALDDLWENPDLCPAPRYMELVIGCPAEEWEEPTLDLARDAKGDAETVSAAPVSLKAAAKEARAASEALAAHETAPGADLEHEAEAARKASKALSDNNPAH